jgi:hypothetical protein
MEAIIMVSSKKIKFMVWENISGRMGDVMKGFGKIAKCMGEVTYFIRMETSIKGTFPKI